MTTVMQMHDFSAATGQNSLNDLAAFVAIAENLSFRAAAARLGVTPSALSHTMRKLEERIGVRLLHRTTRSVTPTDAGIRLLHQLKPAMEQIDGALEGLNEERVRPHGRLRIFAGQSATAAVIAPLLRRYLGAFPGVQLELRVDEAKADIVAMGFDAGIAPRELIAADMVAVRVMEPMKVALVAAPAYLEGRRPLVTPDDLARHDCIQCYRAVDGGGHPWLFKGNGVERKITTRGRLIVNHPAMIVQAAVDGLGIAYTLEAMAEPYLRSGRLIRLLEEWSPYSDGLFLYYPGHRQLPAALRALIDMIQEDRRLPAGGSPFENSPFVL